MVALATSGGGKVGKRKPTASQRSNPKYGGLGAGSKTGKSRTPYRPPVDKKPAPARSNKGGATRGKARAAQVKKTPTPIYKARPLPTSQAAASVGLNAYRDYANSMTNLARTGIRPATGGLSIPNPIDVLGQGLGQIGGVIRDAFGNVVPQDMLFRGIGEEIQDATRRR